MPNYLTYSPSCEAYIETTTADGKQYYDVSQDISSMSITRRVNEASDFTLTLSNKNRKYNGLFMSMDRIVLYSTKTDKYKMLTGYITEVDVFSLYAKDINIRGKCSLYHLQQTYWDPGLKVFAEETESIFANPADSFLGMASLAHMMVRDVGGWSDNSIRIGQMPGQVTNWAMSMYLQQKSDIEQYQNVHKAFWKMMHDSALHIGGGSSGGALSADGANVSGLVYTGQTNLQGNQAQNEIVKLYLSWEGKLVYSQENPGRLDPANTGYGDCSSTICAAYRYVTGMTIGTYTGDMKDNGILIAEGSGQLPIDRMEPADCVLVNHWGSNPTFDHVELYIGNNQLSGHGGGMGPTRKPDAKAYGAGEANWMVRRYIGSGTGK